MTGEYPVAVLKFRDPDLPVQLELTAFSPFAPLDTRLSSMPLAAFVFRVHNPTSESQTVSLAALMQNPIGYDAAGRSQNVSHPNYGGNFNEPFKHAGATGLVMRADAGKEPALDKGRDHLHRGQSQRPEVAAADRPENLTVEVLERQVVPAGKLADPRTR